MLSVIFAVHCIQVLHANCHYTECSYAECHGAKYNLKKSLAFTKIPINVMSVKQL